MGQQVGAQGAAPLHFFASTLWLLAGCSAVVDPTPPPPGRQLFTLLPSSYTDVRFANRLHDTHELNVFTYRNYYSGGGVALRDLTGDGLPEIVLTSSLGGTRLYLNEGKFRFRDITDAAGLHSKGWTTGVTLADVNGDGRLDIYVCHAGLEGGKARANELYINQGVNADGVPTFVEQAAAYGLADTGYSTQAAFFDYDKDGDLDMYLLNHEIYSHTANNLRPKDTSGHAVAQDRLYRNDGVPAGNDGVQAGTDGVPVPKDGVQAG